MNIDNETLNKIEEAIDYRRSKNPLNIEVNKLFNDIYNTEKFNSVFWLGQASVFLWLKNDFYKYLCEYDKLLIDTIINSYLDREVKGFLDKLESE